jgi:hypothetical protein
MCGSSANHEPLPMHIMFASKAENEENLSIRANWVLNLSGAKIKFRHTEETSFAQHLPSIAKVEQMAKF